MAAMVHRLATGVLKLACAALVATVIATTSGPATAERAQGGDPTDLLIVDCLLPPTVQRLGNAVTYLRARKAVKTPAQECRKRGGEYTQAGRETYAELMKVWLPAANAGDSEAQTNLGEIFERGRGGAPQPEIAAQWYRKAAEAGNARAQVNLASLYERGLGVPKDGAQALAWYGRASGLGAPPALRPPPPLAGNGDGGVSLNIRKAQPRPGYIPKALKPGGYHALVIGNNDYRFGVKLSTAVTDAREVAALLQSRYGFKTTLLLNADRYQLLSAINRLRNELTEKDNLLIYYAGHGALDEVNGRGYWLPVDAETNSNANWIPSWQITDLINAMSAGQIMLVADSCFAGTMTRAAIPTLDEGASPTEQDRWYLAMSTRQVRVVLTSGGVKPVLDGGGGAHSVFAAAFIEALRANHGVLEGQRLANEITGKVSEAARRAHFDQSPIYAAMQYAGHQSGDFLFIPRS